ncbi:23S rRNA (guanosine(2251)-2'-O)-methyltransferase RlmB [Pantoea sp. Mhis]|uniref:23S rRNA (guanosine(2251)-2'-O)-methyltransferase RlmB n=1 Tax=Pantoea sp. Mhis TaxID=2576759 RepID=UPI00135C3A98|nr:23S rRNA (guanosine(2251)-2'-O)-methyltransferase RlmB [Pantoea sp. Mhis]MXP56383.1 23S rRNA (guanosine(2251)-2'-O)-methyltransferase RlmB [Pantoea sp. Mhis]
MNEIIFGIHPIQSLFNKDPNCFHKVYVLNNRNNRRLQSLINSLETYKIIIVRVNKQHLDKLSNNGVHQGIVADVKLNLMACESDLPNLLKSLNNPFFLILDCITDPYNLGACLRTADAVGVDAVIIPKDRSAKLNSTVRKISCGAAENVPLIRVTNLVRTIRLLQEYDIIVIGTSEKADNTIYTNKWPNALALVMGREDKGIRQLTRKHCNKLIKIPMNGKVSSLNISVATGIFLYEIFRYRYCININSKLN